MLVRKTAKDMPYSERSTLQIAKGTWPSPGEMRSPERFVLSPLGGNEVQDSVKPTAVGKFAFV
jgi:hypothetical protein